MLGIIISLIAIVCSIGFLTSAVIEQHNIIVNLKNDNNITHERICCKIDECEKRLDNLEHK